MDIYSAQKVIKRGGVDLRIFTRIIKGWLQEHNHVSRKPPM